MKKTLLGATAAFAALGSALLIPNDVSQAPSVTISWTGAGRLQTSSDLVDWNDDPATNSPATFPATNAQQFFRIVAAPGRVNVAWFESDTSDVTGYFLYYGPAPRAYTNRIDAGPSFGVSLTNIQAGATYYFAVTAYNNDQESDFSDEVSYQVQLPILSISSVSN